MNRFPRLVALSVATLFAVSACSAGDDAASSNSAQATASAASSSAASSAETEASPSAADSSETSTAEASESADAQASESSGASNEDDQKGSSQTKTLYDGTTKIFENKRYVALYGGTNGASLGALGEQGPAGSVARIKQLVAEYQPYAKETVNPAFEIIATVASSAAGEDGDYSDESTIDQLMPLIEEAEKNDVYVILDFQPGRSDFLSQVKQYEKLLKHPNVGVGIDPEWRLEPYQVHLEQIGSVDASEINETLDYVAEVTKKNNLPQKMVVLHQFTLSMITNRETLDVSHPELALTLHADGHGTTELKLGGYETLLEGLNKKIKPSWKNFYDEDTPMLTPQQTYELDPKPWVVTYQ